MRSSTIEQARQQQQQQEQRDEDGGGKATDIGNSSKLPPVVGRIERGEKMPICVIMVGMAGSGKSTLLTQLQRSLDLEQEEQQQQQQSASAAAREEKEKKQMDSKKGYDGEMEEEHENDDDEINDDDDDYLPDRSYVVNLDPACLQLPYDVNVDIRDTINYREVMRQHKLGPNGAIMTCLNLFATKFDQVMSILESRAYGGGNNNSNNTNNNDDDGDEQQQQKQEPTESAPMEYILVDTPGQIEAFTWSASGAIIGESLASAFPTVLCFVVDTVRCASSPNTFMSNMLYACSMLYRTRLPLVVCFNKVDVVPHEFCLEWMRDYDAFQEALDNVSESAGFYGSLTRSLSLVLDEFYSNFANAVGVSAVTGQGITPQFWDTVQKAASQDFVTDYVTDMKNRIDEQDARAKAEARDSIRRLQRDINNEEEGA